MTGGLMQLATYGTQDLYLTGNPQITFFKTVYRRHTNFSMETIINVFNSEPGFGKNMVAKIPRSGDLVTKMYVQIIIKKVDPKNNNFAWIRRLGHAILKEVSIEIGGTIFDRQYGTWLDIWYELARKGDHEVGYAKMIGDVPKMTNYNKCIKPEYTLYIPLQFWFNRFVGLAIPTIAIQYHDINIHIDLEKAEFLAIREANFDTSQLKIVDANILTEYVYLATDERKRFAQSAHEYLIEQVQWDGPMNVSGEVHTYRLDYNHPVKELIWAMKNGNYTSGKQFIYYTNNDEWSVEDGASLIIEKSISIGNDPSYIVGGEWIEVESGSFESINTFNISNSSQASVYFNPESLKIGDYGITSKISADIIIDEDMNITCQNLSTTLTIRDFSISTDKMEDTRFNPSDPIVYQFNNYGILIDGSINPVQQGLIQFNGQDRFDRREGLYFNNAQPEQHHSNTPADGINVYSFAFYPEEHQPSGTANFSRIERSDLRLWIKDPTQECELPDLNLFNKENILYIFATNYNVMRVLAGLVGLCYTF